MRTKRQFGKKILGPSSVKIVKSKVVLKRNSINEKLGIGIAIENDSTANRLLFINLNTAVRDLLKKQIFIFFKPFH